MNNKEEHEEHNGICFEFHRTSSRPDWIDVKLKLNKELASLVRIAIIMALANEFPVIAPSMTHKTLADGTYQVAFVLADNQAEQFRQELRKWQQAKQYVKGFANPN